MLKHFEETNISIFRKALADETINAITFPEPARGVALPYIPTSPLKPFQFWYVNESWRENWSNLEANVSDEFNCMANDITSRCRKLLEIFTDLTEDDSPFVSLRAITPDYFKDSKASVSAGWHRDASVFTLQDTIMGEPLEFTDDENVRREYFDMNQIQPFSSADSAILKSENGVRLVPRECVAILKGELRSDESDEGTLDFLGNFIDTKNIEDFNHGRGLIHRGHKDTKNGRLVLTVSTHKIPAWMRNTI